MPETLIVAGLSLFGAFFASLLAFVFMRREDHHFEQLAEEYRDVINEMDKDN
jgi:hypothetical protein